MAGSIFWWFCRIRERNGMDKYTASIAKAMLDKGNLTTLYIDDVPENFSIPSLYFPVPEFDPSHATMNAYEMQGTIYAEVFAATGNKAKEIAEQIAEGIAKDRFLIDIMTADGKGTEGKFRVEVPSTRRTDDRSAQIIVRYKLHKNYEVDTVDYVKYIIPEIVIKTEGG